MCVYILLGHNEKFCPTANQNLFNIHSEENFLSEFEELEQRMLVNSLLFLL